MARVVFSAAARAELIEARDWYSVRGAELNARFTAEIETVVERLATAPTSSLWSIEMSAAHAAGVFHMLLFRIVDGTVHVIACFHSSRDPRQ